MALSDKNISITPNIGSALDPKIVFSGASGSVGPQNITLQVYPTNSGTLSFEGSAGQLFSITNSMSGTIFSVNDVSGIPSIEVLDTGLVKLAQYSGNVLLGSGTDNGTDKLQVTGNVRITGNAKINGITVDQERSTNARIYSAAVGSMGLLGVDSGGSFRFQLYGDGSNYGFLASTWGAWDINKTINGNMTLRVSSVDQTVLHAGNYNSYAPTLTGTGASGSWGISVTGTAASISGFNNPATAATASTIVYRDAGGDIYGRYMFATHFNQSTSNSENPTIAAFWTNSASDNYNRKSTPAHVISQLGLITTSNYNSYALPLSGGTMSGAINMSGTQILTYAGFAGIEYHNNSTWQVYIGSENNAAGARQNSRNGVHTWYNNSTQTMQLSGNNLTAVGSGNFGNGNSTPASTSFSHTLAGISSNRVVNFDGNGNGAPSVWWTSGSRAYGAIDAKDPGLSFWANDGSNWQKQFEINYGNVTVNTDIRSPIFYDSGDTSYYVDAASTSNINTLTAIGALSAINTGGQNSGGSYGLRNVMPGGGSFITSSGTSTGAIRITLPISSSPMLKFTVKVYTYDNLSFDIHCGGHTSGGTWYNTFAYMGTQNRQALNVRFTYGNSQLYVDIGELASTWSYLQVFITDVQVGYADTAAVNWDNSWSISLNTSSFNNINATHTVFPSPTSGANINPVYGTIYYDSNDTAYYLDPYSGGFNLFVNDTNGVITGTVASSGLVIQNNATSGPKLSLKSTAASGKDLWLISNNTSNADGAGRLQFWNSTNSYTFATWGTTGSDNHLIYGSYTQMAGSARAPLFYDSDNTAYYADLATTSRMNAISLNSVAYTSGITSLISAPIITQLENAGTTNTYYPITHQRAYHSAGYVTHLNTGLYKDGGGAWGSGSTGWYAAVGGNDSYPTQAWYLTYDAYIQNSLGYVITSGSFRAPIFYDSNDTAYYLDPASNSVLNTASFAGKVEFQGDAAIEGNTGYGIFKGYTSNNNHFIGSRVIVTGSTASPTFSAGHDMTFVEYLSATDRGFRFKSSDTGTYYEVAGIYTDRSEFAGSVRSPIFYDSNDTAYFVDPRSNSTLSGLKLNGVDNDAAGSGSDAILWINKPNDNDWAMKVTGGWGYGIELRMAASHSYAIQALANGTEYSRLGSDLFYHSASVRAPIFYDSGDTTYYVDAASTSNINALQTAGQVVIGGVFANNAYNAATSARLMFSGGNSDAQSNYYIGTNLENYNSTGSYNRLDLRWHTGIRMGAQATYGGIRFYDSEDLGTQVFAIGKDGSYAQANQSMRAPIFYDLDNTAYYLDAAATGTSLNVAGAIIAGGNITAFSDKRVKKDIQPILDPIEKVKLLNGVTFSRTDLEDKDTRYAGLIAQDVETALPEAVFEDTLKRVDYNAVIGLLVEAVKKQQEEIDQLKAMINKQ